MENRNTVLDAEEKIPDYEKKIGNTCYQVNYYFNQNSTMTMQEKVMKIMKAELDMEVRNPA
ncbi:transposon-encoded TnpW family protein [Mediterraneibacter faecis]|uniref:transposon-encoded TnpW family protein n=1 Tax=Mediterraneibacter faecis TaxID=592978 RepID=UPI0018AC56A3|nr:transposon-encoded TnpW family protein [Mediterraneibacter faecis]